MPKTPLRNVRIEDNLWHAAMQKAADAGTTVSDVVRHALETFVKGKP